MREIKFRGMDINGNWHYGNLAILKQKVGVAEAGSYISNSVGVPFAYDVRPETVGQYIDVLDKNGKEIYMGDLIKKVGENLKGNFEMTPSKIGDIYFVVHMNCGYVLCPIKCFGKLAKNCDGELIPNIWGYIHNYEFWNGARTGAEVIGNIYENPELKGDK